MIEDYFDDMTNIKVQLSHQANSKQGSSVTGDAHTSQIRPNLTVDTDHPAVIDVSDTAKIEGSESKPILWHTRRCRKN